MEIKCKNYPKYSTFSLPDRRSGIGKTPIARVYYPKKQCVEYEKSVNIRPVAVKKVTGLSVIKSRISKMIAPIKNAIATYKKNIKHTYEHKVYFSLVEKQLFGKNTIDGATHDIDKMILYIFGFPKSFVSPFHRKHSTHHIESGKQPNIRTMFIDNLVSSPQLKPEKKLSLREHFNSCPQLQQVSGLREILEQYNFGEDLNFEEIKRLKSMKLKGLKGFRKNFIKMLALLLLH